MEEFYVRKSRDVAIGLKHIEKALKAKVTQIGHKVIVEGDALAEYDAKQVFEALNFGFTVRKALLLVQEDFVFKKIHIKEHTKRSLHDVVARLIGKHGKSKRVLSDISGCEILINDGEVGIIGESENLLETETAIIHLIRGSKHSNMYRFLEKKLKRKKDDQVLV